MPRQETLDGIEQDNRELLAEAELAAVSIDVADLNDAIVRAPGDIAYWNALYTKKLKKYLQAKHDYAIVWSRAWLRIREESNRKSAEETVEPSEDKNDKKKGKAKKKESKAPTLDDLKALVILDEEVQEANLILVEAEAEKERTKKFAESVVAKKDMIQSLGAKLREELRSDFSIREQD